MTTFTYGGETLRVLDLDAERGTFVAYRQKSKTFSERALEEIETCTSLDKTNRFMTVYAAYCETCKTATPEKILRLSLAGQKSVYHPHKRMLTMCNVLTVFINNGKSFEPLWKVRHFESGDLCLFLNEDDLRKILKKYFNQVDLKLGIINFNNVNAIVWQLNTEEGRFYICWHNGCIFKDTYPQSFAFEEKKINELRNTYEILRFGTSTLGSNIYKVVCC